MNAGLEFCEVGFAVSRLEVPYKCSSGIAETLSNVIGGLIRHPLAVYTQILDWSPIICVCVVVHKVDLQIEISIKLLVDGFINIILVDGFLRDGDKFQTKAKNSSCCCRDRFFVVRLWNCLLMKWVKYTPIRVLPSTHVVCI